MELNVFPIELKKHIIFCVVASIFFLLQFIRTKHWYQLVMAAAVPLSLLIYIDPENNYIFYGVGVMEGVLLLLALVLNIIQSRKEAKAEKLKNNAAPETPAANTEG
jgi:TRAP-type C4-dicarboxylate transport system permease small subunit